VVDIVVEKNVKVAVDTVVERNAKVAVDTVGEKNVKVAVDTVGEKNVKVAVDTVVEKNVKVVLSAQELILLTLKKEIQKEALLAAMLKKAEGKQKEVSEKVNFKLN
jgi:N-methylhydantoinase B/oxoprolinase/acetone carboxylase alpha subunit